MNAALKNRLRTILTLFLLLAAPLSAQEAPAAEPLPAAPETAAAATADEDALLAESAGRDPGAVRNEFSRLLREHPPEVGTILALDPTLLGNESFLVPYPDLVRFIEGHPEVRRNPHYYLEYFQPHRQYGELDQMFEMVTIFSSLLLVTLALAWLIRTFVEQKRWNRLSRTQTEVHNKILDRFGSSEELLEYVRTPAGARFLESAPIPLHAADRPSQNPPLSRAILSIQVGVVAAAGAVGMLLVGLWREGETAQALFSLGAIGFCVGLGFVGSAAVSILLSRRLGLWEPQGALPAAAGDDRGLLG